MVDALAPRPAYLLAPDWPAQARALLEQYRASADRHAGSAEFERLTSDLREESAEFRSWWDTHDVAEFRPARRTFDHPLLGRLTFDYAKLAAAGAPDVTMVTCLPSDEETERRLPELNGLTDQQGRSSADRP